MLFIPTLLGIMGAIFCSTIFILANYLFNIEVQSLSILAIFPIGGILLGMCGAMWLFISRKITNTKIKPGDYIMSIFLGLLVFIGVNYISYQTTYVSMDTNGEFMIEQKFSQPESYGISVKEWVDFIDYVYMINWFSRYQYYSKLGNEKKPIKVDHDIIATVLVFIQIFWVTIWSTVFLFLLQAIGSSKYKKDII